MANIFDQIEGSAKKTVESINSADRAVNNLSLSVLEGGKGFENLVASVGELKNMTKLASGAVGEFIQTIPGLGHAGKFVSGLGGAMGAMIGVVESLGEAYIKTLNTFDSFSSRLRRIDADMYELSLRFGGTFDEARKFSDGILAASRTVSNANFGFINVTELQNTAKQLSANRISFEKMSNTIKTSSGTMDLLTAATLQAGASGLDASDYFSKLGDAIMKQGLSSEGATEQIASFREVADDAGLTVSSVAESLSSLSNGFAQMGLSADFGRPLLTGFSRTLNDMGLGIENAIGLSGELSGALASLTTDYATAFVTAQRGGMDLGSGGVLGAGIQLQARLLGSQQSGDEQAQADIATELARGLKETISSFAGGDIVTVQEAASNPALETQFYTQTKILQDMYGINENNAARTLELLSGLDEATRSGDRDSAEALSKQIEEQITARDETLDLMDKQNALTAGMLAETMSQTRALLFMPRAIGEQIMEYGNDKASSYLESIQDGLYDFQSKIINAKSPEEAESLLNNMIEIGKKRELEFSRKELGEEVINKRSGAGNPLAGGDQYSNHNDGSPVERLISTMQLLMSEFQRNDSARSAAQAAGGGKYPGNKHG